MSSVNRPCVSPALTPATPSAPLRPATLHDARSSRRAVLTQGCPPSPHNPPLPLPPPSCQVTTLKDTYQLLSHVNTSMSYPNLCTQYFFHRVSAMVRHLSAGCLGELTWRQVAWCS